jgi:DnaK suppressor protein
MKEQDLNRFLKKLINRRELIRKILRDTEKTAMERGESGERIFHHHISDSATDEELRELAFMSATRLREELAMIEEAISRIREGSYGICLKCSKKIPLDRLKAIPYARYCISCQREIEKTV